MKIAIILGTRPEIIKLYSVIKYCQDNSLNYFIIHTNQHYSENMDQIFFEELNLPKPKYNLNIHSGMHGKQTGMMIEKIEEVLLKEKPTHIFVQGDTNTVLAGALAAAKLNIKICHVEAGLRSYDKTMPEEINRIVTDHISDFLFCPTIKQKKILLSEGISKEKIFITGNTIVDIVYQVKNSLDNSILEKNNLKKKDYILLTMHRPSNVDDKIILLKHIKNIAKIAKIYKLKVIFPIHPRTQKNIEKFNITIPPEITIISPLGFKDLLTLELNARIIITDSGGVQEEACILNIPSLNLRENTERPECVEVGASIVVGTNYKKLNEGFNYYFQEEKKWNNPFGNGLAYHKIFEIIK